MNPNLDPTQWVGTYLAVVAAISIAWGASGGIDTASGGGGDINSVRGTNAFGSGAWEYVASWRWDLDQ